MLDNLSTTNEKNDLAKTEDSPLQERLKSRNPTRINILPTIYNFCFVPLCVFTCGWPLT